MRKESASSTEDDLRAEYDVGTLKEGARGKYYRRVRTGANLVLIEPDLAVTLPDGDTTSGGRRWLQPDANEALRHLQQDRRGPRSELEVACVKKRQWRLAAPSCGAAATLDAAAQSRDPPSRSYGQGSRA